MAGRSLNLIRMIGHVEQMDRGNERAEGSSELTRLTLVTGGTWIDRDGQERDNSERFQIEAYGRVSELCHEYLDSGSLIYLEGGVRTRRWREQDFTERTALTIRASTIVPLGSRGADLDTSTLPAAFTLNRLQLIGNLGRDPEMRFTPQGSAVTSFSVATGGRYTDRSGTERDNTEWFRIDAWERLAEICDKYLNKGTRVYLEGKFHIDRWTDRDGGSRISAKLTATDMTILSGRNDSSYDSMSTQDDDESYDAPPERRAPARAPASRDTGSSRRNVPQKVDDIGDDEIPF